MSRGRPHKCPYCNATRSVAKGFRCNKSGKVRLRRCKECGRRWTVGPSLETEIAEIPQATGGEGAGDSAILQMRQDPITEEAPETDEGLGVKEHSSPSIGGDTDDNPRSDLLPNDESRPDHQDLDTIERNERRERYL